MFSFSQTTGYAIRALACIAGGCEVRQVRDIADCTGIPAPYLAKVIMRLGKAGILSSKRGNKGGVWLARKPGEITLHEISMVVDGGEQFGACLLGNEACSNERACPSHAFWKLAREQIRRHLEMTSLAEVLEFVARCGGRGLDAALSNMETTESTSAQ